MKTQHSPQTKATKADSSAPAADRPATASNVEMPPPTVVEDPEARALLAEDELGNLPLPPEIVSPRLAELETWDAPARESGYRVAPQAAEDESEFPEIFAEEGADEAEEERRELQEETEQVLDHEEKEREEVEDGEREA
jgi:hypothetical protein